MTTEFLSETMTVTFKALKEKKINLEFNTQVVYLLREGNKNFSLTCKHWENISLADQYYKKYKKGSPSGRRKIVADRYLYSHKEIKSCTNSPTTVSRK